MVAIFLVFYNVLHQFLGVLFPFSLPTYFVLNIVLVEIGFVHDSFNY
jgi:hypothetical protein